MESGQRIARHLHVRPYAAIVLEGGYVEAGDGGRWRAVPGDVLIHDPFGSHLDTIVRATVVLNLPLSEIRVEAPRHARIEDPDALRFVAQRDVHEASSLLFERLLPGRAPADDLVDRLAVELSDPAPASLALWSRRAGVRRETAFRWFRSAYGVSPTRFRVETRAWRAWREIVTQGEPLAELAARLGFADQAHLSRAVRALTGCSPRQWRLRAARQPPFKNSRD
jgi:AraC-like DNA-binding protein